MNLYEDGLLTIDLSKSKLDYNLTIAPPTIQDIPLDKESLYLFSLDNPKKFNFISSTLSRWPIVTASDVSAIVDYLAQGRNLSIVDPTMGIFGELIEKFKSTLGLTRKYGIAFNCATNALNAAYRACGLKRGDIVAGAGYTYHATVTPTLELGANLILMDASPEDGNVTLNVIKDTIQSFPTTKIVAVNHNWGIPIREIEVITAYLFERGIKIIEDCSHAHGAKLNNQPVGSFGDISIFSLQANKTLTAGEGGLCFTDDPKLKNLLLLVGHEDTRESTYSTFVNPSIRQTGIHGFQFRMHPIAAALAVSQLNRFHEVLNNRQENYEYLRKCLECVPYIHFPQLPSHIISNNYSIRAAYNSHANGGVDIHSFVAYLKNFGVPVTVDSSGPLARKAVYQQHWAEYGSQALPGRQLFTAQQFPGINAYCKDRLVFPVFSRSHSLVKGIIDVIAAHIINFKRAPA
ncbi:MAG: DegT/DnrJ/EryC1/StrS family aminotransferase [Caldilineaceae bacterium]